MKPKDIENYLDQVKTYLDSKNLDYYDIRLEDDQTTKIVIENLKVSTLMEAKEKGIGIRIIKNKKMGFCGTNKLENYKRLIDDCINNTKKTTKKITFDHEAENNKKIKKKHTSFEDLDLETKKDKLFNLNKKFINKNNITQSNLSYAESFTKKYFVNPNSFIYQEDPRIVSYFTQIGNKNNNYESNSARIGVVGGLENFNINNFENKIKENVKKVNELLNSKPCPALNTNIILTPELVDLLAHEAIGHAAEADAVINDSSVLKLGQVLANNPLINIIDDPSLKNKFGSYAYDDEGMKAKPKHIVKKGIMNEYLMDIESASKLGFKSNASSKADSYLHLPIVRMSNTYFKEGKNKLEDMMSDFSGFLLDGFAGGQVDPSIGTFMFGIKYAHKYEKGKLVGKYKQASISGNILDYLKNITEISDKIGEFGFGFCGKGGQTAYVSGSGPHIKIEGVNVGGTQHE